MRQDTRLQGYAGYGGLDFEPVVQTDGDCYARCAVRISGYPDGEYFSRCEQPRGEVIHYVKGDGTRYLKRYRVRTPTFANLPALFGMARTVGGNLLSRPATRRYPRPVRELHVSLGSRGRIEIDITACIFCGACAKRCPTQALVVKRPEKEWSIDRLRRCTCNACVEVCPKKCLDMAPLPSAPTTTKDREAFRQPAAEGGTA